MVIEVISSEGVLAATRQSLGLPEAMGEVDDLLLASLLRRAAGILCPCAAATLIASVTDGLQPLTSDKLELQRRLRDRLESLLIAGDLLELAQVSTDDPHAKGTWLFAAPPTFVERPDGGVILLGIVPDNATPLPSSLAPALHYEGTTRMLKPTRGESPSTALRTVGWRELSRDTWLYAPRVQPAAQFYEMMLSRLRAQPPSGEITDGAILGPPNELHRYAERWVEPKGYHGYFVARRPQAHGAPLWGYASVVSGTITQFLDFPLPGDRWRGCDIAWHLQMALDAHAGQPQLYRRRLNPDGAFLDFFSPLPLWASRRLMLLGKAAPRERSLYTYWIPDREIAPEESFLKDHLWLKRQD